ncbi:MAG: hypothetical protein EXR82_02930 [Gammaproteobacteria bacterium]|nr:hypothetical protein [Gammaproteobacteria bacterium]
MPSPAATRLAPAPGALPGWVIALLAAGLLSGCSRSVVVDGSFNQGATRVGGYSNILVVGMSPDVNGRCAFEQALAAVLRSATVKATMSCSVLNTKEPLTREAVEGAVASLGADAVLATTLIASTQKAREGGSADARGGGYYKATDFGYDYGFYGAYGVPVVYGEFVTAPSVFSITGTARLATRLFKADDATIVYTLVTKAKNLSSREMAIAEIAPAIAARLSSDGLIR